MNRGGGVRRLGRVFIGFAVVAAVVAALWLTRTQGSPSPLTAAGCGVVMFLLFGLPGAVLYLYGGGLSPREGNRLRVIAKVRESDAPLALSAIAGGLAIAEHEAEI